MDGSKLDRDNLLVLHYENMMREPLEAGEQLATFLGVEQNKRYRQRLTSAHTKSIGSHSKRAPEEVAEAERIASVELQELGYL